MEICVIRGYGERNPHQVCGGTETTKVSFELLRRNLLLCSSYVLRLERRRHDRLCGDCEGDIVYTVEGNTSTTVNGNSVRGVWQHQYPIGSGRILGYGMLS